MAASFKTQLWATLADLDEMGPTRESLASKSAASKLRALRAASAIVASYVRSRYTPPLAAPVEDVTQVGFASGSVLVTGTSLEALALSLKVLAPGGVVGTAIPLSVSQDGGSTYPEATTLATNGVYEAGGLTWTFSGTLAADDTITVLAGVDPAITQYTVNIAAYNLLYNRGLNQDTPDGQEVIRRYETAMAWCKDVQDETAKLDEGSDATPDKRETGIRFGGQQNSWDWLKAP